jgi:putative ABC transport system permease protein
VIGIALITMFTVASATVSAMIRAAKQAQPETYQGTEQILGTVTAVFSSLIAFSVLIAAIGLANSLALSVVQRRREIGLLRALGLPGRGVWRMILLEAAQTTLAASAIGLVLGFIYGWVGAASLLGRLPGGELLVPVLPWQFVLIVVVGSGLLAIIASVAPARRAVRVSPTAALAMD